MKNKGITTIDYSDVLIMFSFIYLIIVTVLCISIAISPFVKENKQEQLHCVYCDNEITEISDYVCCSDGRKYHVNCYLEYTNKEEHST